MGAKPFWSPDDDGDARPVLSIRHKKGEDPSEWPEHLRVQEFPTPEIDGPYVCPGCHAVAGEKCAPDCVDDEIRRETEEAIATGDYERFDDRDDEINEQDRFNAEASDG